MLWILPDPDLVTSSGEQDVPDLGLVVPCRLADTPYTRKELEARIKAVGVPLIVKDVKDGGD